MKEFFSFVISDTFIQILTIISLTSVFIVISYNKFDERRNKANIIVFELRQITKSIEQLIFFHENNNYYDSRQIIFSNIWNVNKYLFMKYLDQDDINLIDEFYDIVQEIEHERINAASSLSKHIEAKINAVQLRISELALLDLELEVYNKKVEDFSNKYFPDKSTFEAFAPKTKLARLIPKIPNILTSSTIEKLKRIGDSKYFFFF